MILLSIIVSDSSFYMKTIEFGCNSLFLLVCLPFAFPVHWQVHVCHRSLPWGCVRLIWQTAVSSFVTRRSKTHWASYLRLLERGESIALSFMEKAICLRNVTVNSTRIRQGSATLLSGKSPVVCWHFSQCTFSLHAAVPLKQLFSSLSFFSQAVF